jgi:hypothetical protein
MRDPTPARRPVPARLAGLAVLLAPAAVLAAVAAHTGASLLAVGAVVSLLAAGTLAKNVRPWRPPAGGPLILLYLFAAAWAWVNTRDGHDPLAAVARGGLLLAAVALVAAHDLHRTGAEPRRRAKTLCTQIQGRRWWPSTLAEVPALPDVQALRAAAEYEPGPVFALFQDPRPEVRVAAFAALDGRSGWRLREACAVLTAAQATVEPEVRAAAVATLGAVDEPAAVAGLTGFFRDGSPEVRRAAVRAAMRDGGRKWAFVRDGVRLALSDPKTYPATEPGGLPGAAGHLPVMAVCDLTTWAGEPEPLGSRAVRTLVDHYAAVLQRTAGGYDLIAELNTQVTDPGTATGLRVEVAGLLRTLGLLTPDVLDRMTNADQPGPVRLLAAEALLDANPADPDALDVLRGLGRQPNREMALSIGRILQTRLGLDMGLPADGQPPAPQSKAAGEVARRVLAWATNRAALPAVLAPTPPAAAPGLLPRPPAVGDGPAVGPAVPPRAAVGKKVW